MIKYFCDDCGIELLDSREEHILKDKNDALRFYNPSLGQPELCFSCAQKRLLNKLAEIQKERRTKDE